MREEYRGDFMLVDSDGGTSRTDQCSIHPIEVLLQLAEIYAVVTFVLAWPQQSYVVNNSKQTHHSSTGYNQLCIHKFI